MTTVKYMVKYCEEKTVTLDKDFTFLLCLNQTDQLINKSAINLRLPLLANNTVHLLIMK